MPAESWADRLKHLKGVRRVDGAHEAVLQETSKEGRAKLTVHVPEGATTLEVKLDHSVKLDILSEGKSADGYLLLHHNGTWRAVVAEVKCRTWRESVVNQAWDQLRAGEQRLALVWRFLGLPEPQVVEAWMVFSEAPDQKNPVAAKAIVDETEARQRWRWFARGEPVGPFTATRIIMLDPSTSPPSAEVDLVAP